MSDQSSLVSLLGPLPDQQTSLHSLLLSLECQARIVHEKVGQLEIIFVSFKFIHFLKSIQAKPAPTAVFLVKTRLRTTRS